MASDDTEFKLKKMKDAKEGYFIVRKDSVDHEEMIVVNIYAYKITQPRKGIK